MKSGIFSGGMIGYSQTGGSAMEWITGIQNAINYIEDHITEPID